jgi:hypothetical protein
MRMSVTRGEDRSRSAVVLTLLSIGLAGAITGAVVDTGSSMSFRDTPLTLITIAVTAVMGALSPSQRRPTPPSQSKITRTCPLTDGGPNDPWRPPTGLPGSRDPAPALALSAARAYEP